MKKLLVIGLVIVSIFTITGCNKSEKKDKVKRVYTYEDMYRQELNKEKSQTQAYENYKDVGKSVFSAYDLDENNKVIKIYACGIYHNGEQDEVFFCAETYDEFFKKIEQFKNNGDFHINDDVIDEMFVYYEDSKFILMGIGGDLEPLEDCSYRFDDNGFIKESWCEGK